MNTSYSGVIPPRVLRLFVSFLCVLALQQQYAVHVSHVTAQCHGDGREDYVHPTAMICHGAASFLELSDYRLPSYPGSRYQ